MQIMPDHGRFSLRILHILLPTSNPVVAHALFPCLMAFSYTLLPSILYIFCLLAQVSPSPSFTFFNLFFFHLLFFFFLHLFYTETHMRRYQLPTADDNFCESSYSRTSFVHTSLSKLKNSLSLSQVAILTHSLLSF